MANPEEKVITVGVTGAPGAILAQAALQLLEADPRVARVHLVVTETGLRLFAHELGIVAPDPKQLPALILGSRATKIELLARAADVCLKEGRRLVLCIRETPLNRIHLESMLRAQQAGAVIMPAIPSYYHQPKTIDDLVEQYVCRVLAQLGLPQEKQYQWRGQGKGRAQEA